MNADDLKRRTKEFAIFIAKLIAQLPANIINNAYCNQLIRCSSSVGANYRAACRGKSAADFINKLKIVEEESDESMFFLELLQEFNPDFHEPIQHNWNEANEILSIIVASINTAKKNVNRQPETVGLNRQSKI